MRSNFLLNLMTAALVAASVPVYALGSDATVAPAVEAELKPEPRYEFIARNATRYLIRNHYRSISLDDAFSSQIFDSYLDALDPFRIYFLASDIDSLKKYQHQFDDDLRKGNVEPAYDIYRLYLQRFDSRYQLALDLLKKEFDFKPQESYQYEREGAPWLSSQKELDELWRKKVKNDVLSLKLTGKKPEEIKDVLSKRYQRAIKRIHQTKSVDVFEQFMNAFTQTIDPHTNYFSPRTSENFAIDMKLSVEGIGATLESVDDYVVIKSLVTAGPADKSKLLAPEDKIIGVAQGDADMVDVIGWRLDDVVALIRGRAGSTVRLQVLSGSAGASATAKVISLIRDKVKLEDEAAKLTYVPRKVGDKTYKIAVITLPKFYADFAALQAGDKNYRSTTRDVRLLIGQLNAEKADGLVMDLRNNGGGSLNEAISLTGLFIKTGPVVQVRDASGEVQVSADEDQGVAFAGPMVVLTNRFSASASEIFAAALQDYGRALVVGEQTFGKGTVQTLADDLGRMTPNDNPMGELKYTTAKFYRINGGSTQHKGVSPDIQLPSFYSGEEFGESHEKHALPWDRIQELEYPKSDGFAAWLPQLEKQHQQRILKDEEFRFLQEDIAELNRQRRDKTLSLNESIRKKERDEADAKLLKRINFRRKLAGEPLLKTLEEQPAKKTAKADKTKEPDPYLYETSAILVDLLQIQSNTGSLAAKP